MIEQFAFFVFAVICVFFFQYCVSFTDLVGQAKRLHSEPHIINYDKTASHIIINHIELYIHSQVRESHELFKKIWNWFICIRYTEILTLVYHGFGSITKRRTKEKLLRLIGKKIIGVFVRYI